MKQMCLNMHWTMVACCVTCVVKKPLATGGAAHWRRLNHGVVQDRIADSRSDLIEPDMLDVPVLCSRCAGEVHGANVVGR